MDTNKYLRILIRWLWKSDLNNAWIFVFAQFIGKVFDSATQAERTFVSIGRKCIEYAGSICGLAGLIAEHTCSRGTEFIQLFTIQHTKPK